MQTWPRDSCLLVHGYSNVRFLVKIIEWVKSFSEEPGTSDLTMQKIVFTLTFYDDLIFVTFTHIYMYLEYLLVINIYTRDIFVFNKLLTSWSKTCIHRLCLEKSVQTPTEDSRFNLNNLLLEEYCVESLLEIT